MKNGTLPAHLTCPAMSICLSSLIEVLCICRLKDKYHPSNLISVIERYMLIPCTEFCRDSFGDALVCYLDQLILDLLLIVLVRCMILVLLKSSFPS